MVLTKNEHMKNLLSLLNNVSQAKSTIFIYGETGVGKEELARFIHQMSPRNKKPFVAVNCAALPGDLLESELFGFQKGAFTGAHQTRTGKIESAEGGTFLLDEISELPLDLQGKLLRVLQEREVEKLGTNETKKIDVRFVCTSNRDLKEMVKTHQFRSDLYYRINVVPVRVPSLRERIEDIEFLAQHFVDKTCDENSQTRKQISPSAIAKIKKWSWPGNIRELQNVIERSVLVCAESVLKEEHLLIEGFEESRASILQAGMTVQEAEKILILKTLEHTTQNRTQAAKLLGISIRTLRNKLNEYKMEVGYESDF